MFGHNKILPPISGDGLILEVHEIFPTLQGEGPYVGTPSVFLRLGGCNLACDFCDTDFDQLIPTKLDILVSKILELSLNDLGKKVRKLVVITGGEPLRQPIESLCQALLDLNFIVQIETNGTLFRKLPEEVKIICSPKISNGKYYQIRPDLLPYIRAMKFIISDGIDEYREVIDVGQSNFNIPVYIQPMDEYDEQKNQKNLERALFLSQSFGYILSLQTHKILGLR